MILFCWLDAKTWQVAVDVMTGWKDATGLRALRYSAVKQSYVFPCLPCGKRRIVTSNRIHGPMWRRCAQTFKSKKIDLVWLEERCNCLNWEKEWFVCYAAIQLRLKLCAKFQGSIDEYVRNYHMNFIVAGFVMIWYFPDVEESTNERYRSYNESSQAYISDTQVLRCWAVLTSLLINSRISVCLLFIIRLVTLPFGLICLPPVCWSSYVKPQFFPGQKDTTRLDVNMATSCKTIGKSMVWSWRASRGRSWSKWEVSFDVFFFGGECEIQ